MSGWGTRLRRQRQSHKHEQGRSHCLSVIFMAKNVFAPIIFLASLETTNNISTVLPYLCTVARHVVCYFDVMLASHWWVIHRHDALWRTSFPAKLSALKNEASAAHTLATCRRQGCHCLSFGRRRRGCCAPFGTRCSRCCGTQV